MLSKELPWFYCLTIKQQKEVNIVVFLTPRVSAGIVCPLVIVSPGI